jgi:hypothetical protein
LSPTYRIDVDDNAEPGRGADTFKIDGHRVHGGAGVLTNGNIRVHG